MERCTAYTCFLTFYQQTGKTPYLLQSPLLEAGLYLYNTRFTKVDGVPYPRHFLPLTHISPFWRGYVSNDNAVYSTKRLHSGMLAPNNRKSAMSLCSTSAPAWNNISNLSANGLFIGM